MGHASSTYDDLIAAHGQIRGQIEALQDDLAHIDGTIRILGCKPKTSDDGALNDLEVPVIEPSQTLQEQVEDLVPVGTSTKASIIAAALKKTGLRTFKSERSAYNRVCAVFIQSPLFERVDKGIYRRIELSSSRRGGKR